MDVKKIVIIGPESTGKSTLCKQLASHYSTEWVPEYAREYLLENGKDYHYGDLLTIANGQLKTEDYYTQQLCKNSDKKLLFIDTDMYVVKVWSEFVFNKCETQVLNNIVSRTYNLYLLCDIDLPWIADELREYPDLESRTRLFHHYKDAMINQAVPWFVISGSEQHRLNSAIKIIDQHF